ncbi:MAG: hypothetical protein MUD00_01620 [Candidatus Pacebacteria bacterium]|nr:hypothetical protein [Candidatus Paceibacterota bacterium]
MEKLMINIVFGDLIGDFFFQNAAMTNNKYQKGMKGIIWCTAHVLVYTATVALFAGNFSPLFLLGGICPSLDYRQVVNCLRIDEAYWERRNDEQLRPKAIFIRNDYLRRNGPDPPWRMSLCSTQTNLKERRMIWVCSKNFLLVLMIIFSINRTKKRIS